jgi:hypothetical protein
VKQKRSLGVLLFFERLRKNWELLSMQMTMTEEWNMLSATNIMRKLTKIRSCQMSPTRKKKRMSKEKKK